MALGFELAALNPGYVRHVITCAYADTAAMRAVLFTFHLLHQEDEKLCNALKRVSMSTCKTISDGSLWHYLQKYLILSKIGMQNGLFGPSATLKGVLFFSLLRPHEGKWPVSIIKKFNRTGDVLVSRFRHIHVSLHYTAVCACHEYTAWPKICGRLTRTASPNFCHKAG